MKFISVKVKNPFYAEYSQRDFEDPERRVVELLFENLIMHSVFGLLYGYVGGELVEILRGVMRDKENEKVSIIFENFVKELSSNLEGIIQASVRKTTGRILKGMIKSIVNGTWYREGLDNRSFEEIKNFALKYKDGIPEDVLEIAEEVLKKKMNKENTYDIIVIKGDLEKIISERSFERLPFSIRRELFDTLYKLKGERLILKDKSDMDWIDRLLSGRVSASNINVTIYYSAMSFDHSFQILDSNIKILFDGKTVEDYLNLMVYIGQLLVRGNRIEVICDECLKGFEEVVKIFYNKLYNEDESRISFEVKKLVGKFPEMSILNLIKVIFDNILERKLSGKPGWAFEAYGIDNYLIEGEFRGPPSCHEVFMGLSNLNKEELETMVSFIYNVWYEAMPEESKEDTSFGSGICNKVRRVIEKLGIEIKPVEEISYYTNLKNLLKLAFSPMVRSINELKMDLYITELEVTLANLLYIYYRKVGEGEKKDYVKINERISII